MAVDSKLQPFDMTPERPMPPRSGASQSRPRRRPYAGASPIGLSWIWKRARKHAVSLLRGSCLRLLVDEEVLAHAIQEQRALGNLQASKVSITGEFVVSNAWRW
jgi:hypothetical protein